jgi:septal ring factor EnvC (AmiA/AmiB activator)
MIWLLLALSSAPQAQNPGEILSRLAETERELLEVQDELSLLDTQAEALREELRTHQSALDEARERVDGRSTKVRQLIRLAYLLNRRGFARILFSAEDPTDLRRRSYYLVSLLSHTDSLVEDFREELDQRQAAVTEVERRQDDLEGLRGTLGEKKTELEAERSERRSLLEQARASEATMAQASAQTLSAQTQLRAEPVPEAVAPKSSTSFRDLQGRLRSPVAQGTQLKGFGDGNRGVDLLAPPYSTVRVVADGVVVRGEPIQGLGMTIVVDHGDGYSTVYAHLGQSKVRKGQEVKRGDYIGVVGETGVVDGRGPRVHFEVRYRNTPQNPADWMGS